MDNAEPRGERHPFWNWLSSGLIALAVVLAAWLLREEIGYFFTCSGPQQLGRAEELEPAALGHNRWVEISGIARDMCIRSEVLRRRVRFSYFMGSEAAGRIMVESPLEDEEECSGAEERAFRGRLLALGAARRYRPVYDYYREKFSDVPAPEQMYVLREGIRPARLWWTPALVALLAGLWLAHFLLMRRARSGSLRRGGEKDDPDHL